MLKFIVRVYDLWHNTIEAITESSFCRKEYDTVVDDWKNVYSFKIYNLSIWYSGLNDVMPL